MAVLLRDDFVRPNSSTSPGAPLEGGPYQVALGTWGINANRLRLSSTLNDAKIYFPGARDMDFRCLVEPGANGGGIFARRWGGTGGYFSVWRTGSTSSFHVLTGSTLIVLHELDTGSFPVEYRVLAWDRWVTASVTSAGGQERWFPIVEDQWSPASGAFYGGFRSNSISNYFLSAEADTVDARPAVFTPGSGAAAVAGGGRFAEAFVPTILGLTPRIYKGRDSSAADEGALA